MKVNGIFQLYGKDRKMSEGHSLNLFYFPEQALYHLRSRGFHTNPRGIRKVPSSRCTADRTTCVEGEACQRSCRSLYLDSVSPSSENECSGSHDASEIG